MSTTTFETAKVGDRVFSHTFGCGVIDEINEDSNYPIVVVFDIGSDTFTLEGSYRKSNPTQCLFWDKCTIEAPIKPSRMKLIHGVEVSDISFHPTDETDYYYPDTTEADMVSATTYYDKYPADTFRSANNLCYPYTEEGKAAAVLHAKAMLDIPV
jgi:hypothetical protein